MPGVLPDLFDAPVQPPARVALGEQAWLLRGFALPHVEALRTALRTVLRMSLIHV